MTPPAPKPIKDNVPVWVVLLLVSLFMALVAYGEMRDQRQDTKIDQKATQQELKDLRQDIIVRVDRIETALERHKEITERHYKGK